MPLRAVRATDPLLRQLLANLPNGSVSVFDRQLRYLFAAGQGLAQVGLTAEGLVGRRLAEVFDAAAVAYVTPFYTRALAGEAVSFDLPVGEWVYSINAGPLTDDEGSVHAIVAVAQDVTARVAAEAREQAVRAELEAALQAREAFFHSLTHDLKSPLTTITGLTELLERQTTRGRLDADQLQQSLTSLRAAAATMTGMVDELLDLARLQSGQTLELHRTATDLVALARQVVAARARTASEHRLAVETAVPELLGDYDAPRLERVLANLVGNAVNYSPEGGTVTVALRRVKGNAGAPWAELTVTDQGLGIPAAELPRVFERFYRGSNVAGRIPGSGIGLAGARQIVEQHGGTLTLTSTLGQGTTVTLRLPLA